MSAHGGGETHPLCKKCRDGVHATCLPDRAEHPSECRCQKCRIPRGVMPC